MYNLYFNLFSKSIVYFLARIPFPDLCCPMLSIVSLVLIVQRVKLVKRAVRLSDGSRNMDTHFLLTHTHHIPPKLLTQHLLLHLQQILQHLHHDVLNYVIIEELENLTVEHANSSSRSFKSAIHDHVVETRHVMEWNN